MTADLGHENRVAASVVEIIGHTPAVELSRLTRGIDGRIVAKLDYLNPGFSKKDRIARQIVEDAIESGELRPGQTVVELTSGNTGTGLAIVCAVRGHPFVAVMSEGNSRERARMMRALGAEVVLVAQTAASRRGQVSGDDLALVETRARELTRERNAFRADQFVRLANRAAHETHTGPELWAQTGGRIDAFCEFVGSGGTYAGITLALKARRPSIACYVVEPATAAILAGLPVTDPNHRVQGGDTRRRTSPCFATCRSMGISRSPTRRPSMSRADSLERRASSPAFPRAPSLPRHCACSPETMRVGPSPSCSPIPG